MYLSKKEREILKEFHPEIPLRRVLTFNVFSNSFDTAWGLYRKGFLVADYSGEDNVSMTLSDCAQNILHNHPELLHRNAFSAFLSRWCTFIKENLNDVIMPLILLILSILIIVHEYG